MNWILMEFILKKNLEKEKFYNSDFITLQLISLNKDTTNTGNAGQVRSPLAICNLVEMT